MCVFDWEEKTVGLNSFLIVLKTKMEKELYRGLILSSLV